MNFVLQMLRAVFFLNATTISTILSLLSNSSDFSPGFQIHLIASKSGYVSDTIVGNALITFYSRSWFMHYARKMFDEMRVRDTVSWNAFIYGFAQEGNNGSEVIPLFLRMLKENRVFPNKTTIATVVTFCGSIKFEAQLHCLSSKIGVDGDILLCNVLISMYYRNGALDYARNIFSDM
jgi:PPR repeat